MFQLGAAPKVQDMAITGKTFVQRIPESKDSLGELLAQTNEAFVEQREADCELWISRVYALLDKEHSRPFGQTSRTELTATD